MKTRELKNHPGHYLRTDAADAFDAMEDEYGVIVLNRAGVPEAVQQGLIDRWDKGGPANRPPFLYEPKRPAWFSEHVQYIAVDVYNYTSDRHKLNKYGFKWYGPKDPVHYTFTGWKGRQKPSTPAKPKPIIEGEDEVDMLYIYDTEKGIGYAIHPVTGKKRQCSRPEWDAVREAEKPVANVTTKRAAEARNA